MARLDAKLEECLLILFDRQEVDIRSRLVLELFDKLFDHLIFHFIEFFEFSLLFDIVISETIHIFLFEFILFMRDCILALLSS